MKNKFDNVVISFEDIYEGLPKLLDELISAPKYEIKSLTEGTIKKVFGEDSLPIEGVFLISDHTNNKVLYVGRSRNLATRIGVDLRALTREQATISYKLTTLKDEYPNLITIRDAREYMYKHYSVQMIKVPDENERAIFQIYAAIKLGTINVFNSFRET
ncbi:hypothetical protein P9D43_29140 [Neobacillus niacini]|uniref:hypothetical protein n=1 Tax=Neobacillus niacini TaxID=86668 RepID=UPI00052F53D9|nr:hypothetical protein [Neobacillus niacini]KGM45489.1 hypothetical protein NP83_05755 [Neobacillus niacini]MEC1526061.1 hypothetical protein [Neobacillus niacini]